MSTEHTPRTIHLDLCASQDDTMSGHPICDCGAVSTKPRSVVYGGDEMKAFQRAAIHSHTTDGGVMVAHGDGVRVLHVRHPSRRNPRPEALMYEPGGLNQWGNQFIYSDYFLAEELALITRQA